MKKICLKKNYLTPVFETNDNSYAEWFGYYNYDTLDTEHKRLLCNRAQIESPQIRPSDKIEVGYYKLQDGKWHGLGVSDSWNWQQGAMLQWLPMDGRYNKVIYNSSMDGHLVSIIYDFETGKNRIIDWPIYGIMPNAKASISIDFERSYWCRAYHYMSIANPEKDGNVLSGDGIFLIDLVSNKRSVLIDIETIIKTDYRSEFEGKKHWLEHVMISPSGKRFCFLHRYADPNNIFNYKTRLCLANSNGTGLQVVSGWESFRWSHFGWQGDDAFAIYTNTSSMTGNASDGVSEKNKGIKFRVKSYIKKNLPVYFFDKMKYRDRYYQRYELNNNGVFQLVENMKKPYFSIDGHPSFTSDGKYMITDSYVDGKNYRRVIIHNVVSKKGLIVAKFLENCLPDNVPCDLHPKLSQDNNYIVFDTTNTGKHKMNVYQINWDLVKSRIE